MKNLLIIILVITFSFTAKAADIADFAVKGEKVYSPTLSGAFLVYMIAPDRLAGWSGTLMEHELKYLPKKYQDLPVLGGWQKDLPIDKELIAKYNITKAFVLGDPDKPNPRVDELKSLGMDVLIMKADDIYGYIPLFRELARQMGLTERGNELALFGEEMLIRTRVMVKDIPDSEKKRVYAGSGSKGLSAMCYMDSMEIAGGKNAYECPPGTEAGAEKPLTLEEVKGLKLDVILLTNPAAATVMDDSEWQKLAAYKEKRLYVVPYGPFGWLHHFSPYTRVIGTPWLACKLYPKECSFDIEKEAKRYYKLFLGVELSEKQLEEILYRYGK